MGVHLIRLPDPLPANLRIVPLFFLSLSGLVLVDRGRPRDWSYRLGLLLWFVLPVMGLYLISLELPLFTERYLIWTMPAVYALAALGAKRLGQDWGTAAWALVLVLFLLGLGYQARYPIKPDMRDAVAYVESQRAEGDVVMLHLGYLIHSYLYYAPDARPHLREAPAPGPHGTLDATGADILGKVGPARGVWLVESESAMWDPRGLVRAWLEQHARVVSDRNFVGVRVTYFRLR